MDRDAEMGPERRALDGIDRTFERAVADLQDAIRIPGISKRGTQLHEMAGWVARQLQSLGAEVTMVPGRVAPIVEGDLSTSGAAYTLLFYTLYDVQPADEPDWSVPPFAAEIVTDADGRRRLVGRGAFNSKGPLVGFIAALRAIKSAGVPVPVNIRFLIEGEEEIGSPSLEPHVRANLSRYRQCDGAFLPYLGTNMAGETAIRLGFKGLAFIEFSVAGGEWGGPARHDVHAMHTAWLANPAWELISALSTLQTRHGTLTIDDLPARPGPDGDDMQLLREAAAVLSSQTILDEIGARRFKHDVLFDAQLGHFLFDPTLNIEGVTIGSGQAGAEPATHLAHRASAILDLRLVPGMDVAQTLALIRRHLDRRGYTHVTMSVRDGAYPASRCSSREPIVQALVSACRKHSERVTVLPMHAGAAPLYLFTDVIGIPYAFGGLGHGGRPHARDEYVSIDGLKDHIKCVVSFLFGLSGTRPC